MTVLKEKACVVCNNNKVFSYKLIIKVDSSLIKSDKKDLEKRNPTHLTQL